MKRISFLLVVAMLATQTVYADQVVLVTNKSNTITALKARDALNIYLGKKSRWDDGTAVVALTQANTAITEEFTQEYVKKSANQFSLYWRKAIFTGTGTPPVEVTDSASMKASVASQKGAIGYILESELDDSVKRIDIL